MCIQPIIKNRSTELRTTLRTDAFVQEGLIFFFIEIIVKCELMRGIVWRYRTIAVSWEDSYKVQPII